MMRASDHKAMLVVGVPRSGTTWIARVLAEAIQADYVEEPDNHFRRPFAFCVKRRLGRGEYPALVAHEEAPEYERLWRRALEAGDPTLQDAIADTVRRRVASRLLAAAEPHAVSAAIDGARSDLRLRAVSALAVPDAALAGERPRIVKSVHAAFALEWILARVEAAPLLVFRQPLNVLSSWSQMGWLGQARKDMLNELHRDARDDVATRTGIEAPVAGASPLARAAWLVGALTASLLDAIERHPAWPAVSHEALCARPHEAFRELAERLGIRWSEDADALLSDANRPGTGYEIARVSNELPDAWRTRLTAGEVAEAQRVLQPFGLGGRLRRACVPASPRSEA